MFDSGKGGESFMQDSIHMKRLRTRNPWNLESIIDWEAVLVLTQRQGHRLARFEPFEAF